MSKIIISLRQHFAAFVGNAEARVAIVADAIVAAVILAAVSGQQGPLVDALAAVGALKGNAKSLEALRQGIIASGLTLSANGRTTQAPGLRIGKMTPDAGETLAVAIGEAFTVGASMVLTAKTPAKVVPASEIAARAFAALGTLTLRDLRKALAGNDARALLANLALIAEEDVRALAVKAASEALEAAAKVTPTDGPIGVPAVDAAMA